MKTGPIFLPQGAVTGIGSLPLTDPQAALAFVAQLCPEVPFWPQLPRRSVEEQMIEQVLGSRREFFVQRVGGYGYQVKPGQLCACLEEFSAGTATLNEQCASGFFAFERACASHVFTRAQALKGQLVGPITLACSLFAEERVAERLWQRLSAAVTPEQRTDLEGLLARAGTSRISNLECLRRAPSRASAPVLVQALARLTEARELDVGSRELGNVPASRIKALALYAVTILDHEGGTYFCTRSLR